MHDQTVSDTDSRMPAGARGSTGQPGQRGEPGETGDTGPLGKIRFMRDNHKDTYAGIAIGLRGLQGDVGPPGLSGQS